jgi:guanylate kinase
MKPIHGILCVLSAPTGGGKTTVAAQVLENVGRLHPFSRVITYTTRPMRPTEKNGVDYHFVTEQEFLKKKAENFFLETNNYDGKWYGSPRSLCKEMAEGKSFLVITDRNGARSWKHAIPEAVLIWLTVPDASIIAQRLHQRGTDSEETIQRRIAIASHEIAEENKEHLFTYHVMNDNLATAVRNVTDIICTEIEQA